MRSRIASSLVLLAFSNVHATVPVSCPATLTCNGDLGSCNQSSEWQLDFSNAIHSFTGIKTIALSKIWAVQQGGGSNAVFQFECTYSYGEFSTTSNKSSISLYTYVKHLEGDWKFTGFGGTQAFCQSVDPTACTGSN